MEAVLWHGLESHPVPADDLSEALSVITEQRLAPLALAYATAHSVALTKAQQRTLRLSDFSWSAHGAAVTQAGNIAMDLFAAAGIEVVAFKGPAIRKSYASPRYRLFSDMDILVKPHDYRRARELLEARGWREDLASAVPYDLMNRVCREAQNLKGRPGESVDLHHHLPPWLWTNHLRFPDIRADSEIVDGRRTMNPEWNLLVAALHLVSDKSKPGQTLIIWRDLAELARSVDQDRMALLAQRARLGPWIRTVLGALPPSVRPDALIDAMPAGRVEHRNRLLLLNHHRLVGRRIPLVQLFRLPAPRALVYALGMLLPPPSYIHRRYGAFVSGYRQWWTGVE